MPERKEPIKAKRLPKNTPCTKLRTQIILYEIQRIYHDTLYDINIRNRLHGLPWKWIKGEKSIGRINAYKLDPVYPKANIKEIYNSPLFRLLENRPLSSLQIETYVAAYIPDKEEFYSPAWLFDEDKHVNSNKLLSDPLLLHDSDTLFQRGDSYGFIAILALLRFSETSGNWIDHHYHMLNLYRAFPAHAKNKPYRKFYNQLLDLTEQICNRVNHNIFGVDPDLSVIEKQIKSKDHQPNRSLRIIEWRQKGNMTRAPDLEEPFKSRDISDWIKRSGHAFLESLDNANQRIRSNLMEFAFEGTDEKTTPCCDTVTTDSE